MLEVMLIITYNWTEQLLSSAIKKDFYIPKSSL